MPRLIPEIPTFTTGSEKEVWERLRDTLDDDDVLLANLRLTDGDKDHEADLVVLMPDVGVLVLEVKGGSVTVEPDDARDTGGGPERGRASADPPRRPGARHQARTAPLRRQHPRGGTPAGSAWGHGVVTPYFDCGTSRPDCRGGRSTTRTTRWSSRSGSATNAW